MITQTILADTSRNPDNIEVVPYMHPHGEPCDCPVCVQRQTREDLEDAGLLPEPQEVQS